MSETTDDIAGIDLDDDSYTVVQGWLRNTFKAMDSDGSVVLRGKQKILKLKEPFPFTDGQGRFSLRDTYDVSVDDASDVPTEPVIAAARVIDAIQGNRAATRQLRYRYIRFIESGYFRLTLPWLYIGGRGIPPMSNRVEDLENQVAELQATIDGLTEELVETKERVRELEAQTEEFEDLVVSASAEQAPLRAKQAQTTAEQQAEARGTDERRDAQIVENQEPVEAEAGAADAAAEEPTDAPAEEAEDDDDDDGIIVA